MKNYVWIVEYKTKKGSTPVQMFHIRKLARLFIQMSNDYGDLSTHYRIMKYIPEEKK
jgi:hypothetical protein